MDSFLHSFVRVNGNWLVDYPDYWIRKQRPMSFIYEKTINLNLPVMAFKWSPEQWNIYGYCQKLKIQTKEQSKKSQLHIHRFNYAQWYSKNKSSSAFSNLQEPTFTIGQKILPWVSSGIRRMRRMLPSFHPEEAVEEEEPSGLAPHVGPFSRNG